MVNKTTVYLTDELQAGVKRVARSTGSSEASVIRRAIREVVASYPESPPQGALFFGPGDGLSEHVDEALDGFGER